MLNHARKFDIEKSLIIESTKLEESLKSFQLLKMKFVLKSQRKIYSYIIFKSIQLLGELSF